MRCLGVYFVLSPSLKCSLDTAKRGFYRTANSNVEPVASDEVLIQLTFK